MVKMTVIAKSEEIIPNRINNCRGKGYSIYLHLNSIGILVSTIQFLHPSVDTTGNQSRRPDIMNPSGMIRPCNNRDLTLDQFPIRLVTDRQCDLLC